MPPLQDNSEVHPRMLRGIKIVGKPEFSASTMVFISITEDDVSRNC
jgi:hypothetical protein